MDRPPDGVTFLRGLTSLLSSACPLRDGAGRDFGGPQEISQEDVEEGRPGVERILTESGGTGVDYLDTSEVVALFTCSV